jgi:hypothetical protein
MKSEYILPNLTGATVVATAWLFTVVRPDLFIGYAVALAAVAFAVSEYAFGGQRRIGKR